MFFETLQKIIKKIVKRVYREPIFSEINKKRSRSSKVVSNSKRVLHSSQTDSFYIISNEKIPLTVIKSPKRKRSMTMKVDTDWIKILAPVIITRSAIDGFLWKKKDRIAKKRQMMLQRQRSIEEFRQWSLMPYLWESFTLNIETNKKTKSGIVFKNNVFTCFLPVWGSNQEQKKNIAKYVKQRYMEKAKDFLPTLLQQLANKHNLSVGKVIIKSYRAKYGQCAGQDISLSYKIIQFPIPIIHHIILHELAHLKHKNHGSSFRKFLQKIDWNTKEHVKRLREHGVMLD